MKRHRGMMIVVGSVFVIGLGIVVYMNSGERRNLSYTSHITRGEHRRLIEGFVRIMDDYFRGKLLVVERDLGVEGLLLDLNSKHDSKKAKHLKADLALISPYVLSLHVLPMIIAKAYGGTLSVWEKERLSGLNLQGQGVEEYIEASVRVVRPYVEKLRENGIYFDGVSGWDMGTDVTPDKIKKDAALFHAIQMMISPAAAVALADEKREEPIQIDRSIIWPPVRKGERGAKIEGTMFPKIGKQLPDFSAISVSFADEPAPESQPESQDDEPILEARRIGDGRVLLPNPENPQAYISVPEGECRGEIERKLNELNQEFDVIMQTTRVGTFFEWRGSLTESGRESEERLDPEDRLNTWMKKFNATIRYLERWWGYPVEKGGELRAAARDALRLANEGQIDAARSRLDGALAAAAGVAGVAAAIEAVALMTVAVPVMAGAGVGVAVAQVSAWIAGASSVPIVVGGLKLAGITLGVGALSIGVNTAIEVGFNDEAEAFEVFAEELAMTGPSYIAMAFGMMFVPAIPVIGAMAPARLLQTIFKIPLVGLEGTLGVAGNIGLAVLFLGSMAKAGVDGAQAALDYYEDWKKAESPEVARIAVTEFWKTAAQVGIDAAFFAFLAYGTGKPGWEAYQRSRAREGTVPIDLGAKRLPPALKPGEVASIAVVNRRGEIIAEGASLEEIGRRNPGLLQRPDVSVVRIIRDEEIGVLDIDSVLGESKVSSELLDRVWRQLEKGEDVVEIPTEESIAERRAERGERRAAFLRPIEPLSRGSRLRIRASGTLVEGTLLGFDLYGENIILNTDPLGGPLGLEPSPVFRVAVPISEIAFMEVRGRTFTGADVVEYLAKTRVAEPSQIPRAEASRVPRSSAGRGREVTVEELEELRTERATSAEPQVAEPLVTERGGNSFTRGLDAKIGEGGGARRMGPPMIRSQQTVIPIDARSGETLGPERARELGRIPGAVEGVEISYVTDLNNIRGGNSYVTGVEIPRGLSIVATENFLRSIREHNIEVLQNAGRTREQVRADMWSDLRRKFPQTDESFMDMPSASRSIDEAVASGERLREELTRLGPSGQRRPPDLKVTESEGPMGLESETLEPPAPEPLPQLPADRKITVTLGEGPDLTGEVVNFIRPQGGEVVAITINRRLTGPGISANWITIPVAEIRVLEVGGRFLVSEAEIRGFLNGVSLAEPRVSVPPVAAGAVIGERVRIEREVPTVTPRPLPVTQEKSGHRFGQEGDIRVNHQEGKAEYEERGPRLRPRLREDGRVTKKRGQPIQSTLDPRSADPDQLLVSAEGEILVMGHKERVLGSLSIKDTVSKRKGRAISDIECVLLDPRPECRGVIK